MWVHPKCPSCDNINYFTDGDSGLDEFITRYFFNYTCDECGQEFVMWYDLDYTHTNKGKGYV